MAGILAYNAPLGRLEAVRSSTRLRYSNTRNVFSSSNEVGYMEHLGKRMMCEVSIFRSFTGGMRGCSIVAASRKGGRLNRAVSTSLQYELEIGKVIVVQASMTDPGIRPKVDPKSVACMILGVEAGSHLFPLTKRRAKPAVPFGGAYTLIDIQMSNCINSGLNKVYVLTQYNSTSLNRHISRTYNNVTCPHGSVEVLAATQTPGDIRWFMGTADAVRRFAWILDDVRNQCVEYVLILSGDHLYRMDYMDFVRNHLSTGADITVSCAPLPIDDKQGRSCDLLQVGLTGQVMSFPERYNRGLDDMDADTVEEAMETQLFASMGIYVFNKNVLLQLLRSSYPDANDFASEVLPAARKTFNIQAYLFNSYWRDVGTIESFFDAHLELTEQQPEFQFFHISKPIYTSPRYLPPTKAEHCRVKESIVSHGCFFRDCRIDHSVIGIRSRIESGVEMTKTVMMGADDYETEEERRRLRAVGKIPLGVGNNSLINRCIIDRNARIGENVILINVNNTQETENPSEGYYIRSGIIVVLENATIRDGLVV